MARPIHSGRKRSSVESRSTTWASERPAAGSASVTASRRPASGEDAPQRVQLLRHRAVVHPGAVLAAGDQTGLAQHLEVVADRRLALADRRGEVAGARLAGRGGGDDAEQPQAHRVGQRLERLGQALGGRRRPGRRCRAARSRRRRAAGRGGWWAWSWGESIDRMSMNVLTDVEHLVNDDIDIHRYRRSR